MLHVKTIPSPKKEKPETSNSSPKKFEVEGEQFIEKGTTISASEKTKISTYSPPNSPKKIVVKRINFSNEKEIQDTLQREADGITKYNLVNTLFYSQQKNGKKYGYIATRHFNGPDLLKLKPKNWFEKFCICRAAAQLLLIIHSNGDVYADVKSENFIFTEENVLALVDFEYLNIRDYCGSLLYTAKEIRRHESFPSYSSDIHALGKTFIEFLAIYDKASLDKDPPELALDPNQLGEKYPELEPCERNKVVDLLNEMTQDNSTQRPFLSKIIATLNEIISNHQIQHPNMKVKHFFEIEPNIGLKPTPPPINDVPGYIDELEKIIESIIKHLTPISKDNAVASLALGKLQDTTLVNYPITFYQLRVKIDRKRNPDEAFAHQVTYDFKQIFSNFRPKKIFSKELITMINEFLQLPEKAMGDTQKVEKLDIEIQNDAMVNLKELMEESWWGNTTPQQSNKKSENSANTNNCNVM